MSLISGYRIPFFCRPPLRKFRKSIPQGLSTTHSSEMTAVIKDMLSKDIITPAKPTDSGFISHMFLRKKINGKMRPIFNLKNLNRFLRLRKFRLINHIRVPSFLQEGDYLCTIDLSDAYCHVPVKKSHQRFLSFHFRGKTFSWKCLPFGLASAPQAFSQLTNWVAALLRKQGLRIIVYLDDFLLAAQSFEELVMKTKLTVSLLRTLGWQINLSKSRLVPSHTRTFLGLVWNTTSQSVSLPDDKIRSLQNQISLLQKRPRWSLRSYQRLLGQLNFAAFAIPLGRLHLRPFQLAARTLPKLSPRKLLPIPPAALETLKWWKTHLREKKYLPHSKDRIILSTDASDWGLGISIGADIHLQLEWSAQQRSWHINKRELFAVSWAISTNPHLFKNRSIILLTDSRVVAGQIRNQGGLKSPTLLKETWKLLHLVNSLQALITPLYIPSHFNSIADSLSRNSPQPEWHLTKIALEPVFRRWGTPSIDLFASQYSNIVKNYVTMDPRDRNALFVNAFSQPWTFRLAWVFPPPPLIPLVLDHLNKASGTFLIVAPRWTKTFWRPDLKARAVDAPIKLKNLDQNLVDLSTMKAPLKVKDIQLEVWKVRGGPPTFQSGTQQRKCY